MSSLVYSDTDTDTKLMELIYHNYGLTTPLKYMKTVINTHYDFTSFCPPNHVFAA